VENQRNDAREIIACRKCSQKIRVKNKTGMVECPSCSHSWLFERKEESGVINSSPQSDLRIDKGELKTVGGLIVIVFLGLVSIIVIIGFLNSLFS
jgi:DNA-directed RNA polymerase subunit RPC12/RpoP